MPNKEDNQASLISAKHNKPAKVYNISPGYIGLLCLLIFILILGFLQYSNQKLQQQINSLTRKTSNLQQDQTSAKDELNTMGKSLEEKQAALSHKVKSALQEHALQKNDWALSKARYYLELAEINLKWTDNIQTSLDLFKQANELLAQVPEPRISAIQQAITQDEALLKAIPQLDSSSGLSQLDQVQQLIAHLPLKPAFKKADPSQDSNTERLSNWREHLNSSLAFLEKIIIIHHHDKPIEPLKTPQYEAMLRDSISINLRIAKWAVIQRNQLIYRMALTDTLNDINQTFDSSQGMVMKAIEQLNQLQKVQLTINKPNIGHSLLLLNRYMLNQNNDDKKNPLSMLPVFDKPNHPDQTGDEL